MKQLSRRSAATAMMTIPAAFGATEATAQNDMRSTREATLRAFYEPFSGSSPEIYDRILTETWTRHPSPPNIGAGPGPYKPFITQLRQASPDLRIEIQDILIEGQKGAVRSVLSAVHTASLFGFAPTGKPFRIMTIDVHRFEDGKIAETWHVEDWLDAMRQSGALKGP
jgi:ketosteroid isomerase-like protein